MSSYAQCRSHIMALWGRIHKEIKKKEKITDFGMFTCKCFEEHRWEAILCSFITRQLTFPRLLNPSLGFLLPSLLKFWVHLFAREIWWILKSHIINCITFQWKRVGVNLKVINHKAHKMCMHCIAIYHLKLYNLPVLYHIQGFGWSNPKTKWDKQI